MGGAEVDKESQGYSGVEMEDSNFEVAERSALAYQSHFYLLPKYPPLSIFNSLDVGNS